MRLKRTWGDWLPAKLRLVGGLLGILLVYLVAALVIALMLARASDARPVCQPPDPSARPIIKLTAGEIRSLAALAWAEARGEPEPYCAMQAVAAVVVNRMRTNPAYFGASITQVLNKPYAFSPFGRDDPQRRKVGKVDESDRLFVTALLAAIAAVSGADPVGGADHFYSGARPRWTHGMAVTARLSHHTFLRSR